MSPALAAAQAAFQRRHIATAMKRLRLPNERGVWAWIRRVLSR